jgi:hypothetical protein
MTMRWSGASADDVAVAVKEFARRIGVFDPPSAAGAAGNVDSAGATGGVGAPGSAGVPGIAVVVGDAAVPGSPAVTGSDGVRDSARHRGGDPGGDPGGVDVWVDDGPVMRLSPGVARAFVEALRAYQDPRDRGTCDHCGGPRLDDNFVCADCGQPSGLFGQLLRERAARYEGPAGELGSESDGRPGG